MTSRRAHSSGVWALPGEEGEGSDEQARSFFRCGLYVWGLLGERGGGVMSRDASSSGVGLGVVIAGGEGAASA